MPRQGITFDFDTRNYYIDDGEAVVRAQALEDVTIKDPEILMTRLKEITTPRDQFIHFIRSIVDPGELYPTHEGRWTRFMALSGVTLGWLAGGFGKTSRHYHEDYARKHNASVFDNHYRAKRHKYDTYIFTILRRGLGPGIKAGLLCLSTGFICFGSITYRGGRLYYPDWALSFATLGAVSRSWLGTRGLAGGAMLGLIAGSLGYGIARGMELATGMTVAEFRYEQEVDYVRKREALVDRCRRQREGWVKERAE